MSDKGRIMVGMSGGVDSSVAALLLQKDGWDVAGVTMLLKPSCILTDDDRQKMYREAQDAAEVCRVLGIKHFTPDFSELFRENVIEYFAGEYFEGRTPNPCVMCNKTMKFGRMLDFAEENGYGYIATGHYARIEKSGGRFLLKKADNRKDQSYFLYSLNQRQLARTIMPLNRMEKPEARALAEEYGLPVAQKPDSQEVCFVKNDDYIAFIEHYSGRKAAPGHFVDENGHVLGEHKGIYRYTIGQRKGLGITFGEPRFVTSIDPLSNTVTLGRDGSQYKSSLTAGNLNFIPFDRLEGEIEAEAKVRYQASPSPARVLPMEGGKVKVLFTEPQRSVTPGQAVVFYNGDIVIGGGTIEA